MDKVYIQWYEFFEDLHHTFKDYAGTQKYIYGVPKGGMIVAGHLTDKFEEFELIHDPSKADIIVDDIVDSGGTKEQYKQQFPDTTFIALYDADNYEGKWVVFPWEADHPAGEESVQDNIVRILEYIGEDPDRDGLQETPKRVVKSWNELFSGYDRSPREVLTTFDNGSYDQIVLLDNIEMYSTCEHHMLPFTGRAHVAYIPDDKIIGISKLARLVEIYARRLQVQERIGEQVTDALMKHLKPKGAACIIEAQHMCMCARGVNKQHSVMKTSSLKGAFMEKPEARQELMSMIL